MNGKAGFVHVQAVFAGIFDFLRNAAVFVAVPRFKVALGEVAVFIQCFPVPKGDFLTRFSSNAQFRIACQVLPEINDRFSVGRFDDPAGKAFLLQDGHALGLCQIVKAEVPHSHTVPIGDLLHPGVIGFTDFQIIFTDGAGLTGLPGFITAQNDGSVQFQLAEQGQVIPVKIPQAVDAHIATIPAIAQDHEQLVFTGFQQFRYIIALHCQALAVIPGTGSQHKITHPLPIQESGVQAMAGDVQASIAGLIHRKPAAEIRRGLLGFRVMGQLRVDPFGPPNRQSGISDQHFSTSPSAILR